MSSFFDQCRTIYWTTRYPGKISRASMDGADPAAIVTGLVEPMGVFVDLDSSRLFWTDYRAHRIQSSELDGGDVRDILQLPELTHPYGIVVYEDRIYWGTHNWGSNLLQSCNKSGEDVRTLYMYNGTAVTQIILINYNNHYFNWTGQQKNDF